MFHVKQSYRFSQDYLSETWPLQPAGRVWARRIAGADPMIEGHQSDPIGRGPCPIRRSVRRISFSSGSHPAQKGKKNLGKTGGFPPIRDFLLKIRSRFGDRVPRFFGDFWQKPQKRTKKTALSSSSSALDGLEAGELLEARGPQLDFDVQRDDIRGSRAGFRPLLNDFRRTKGRFSSISCPVAVS